MKLKELVRWSRNLIIAIFLFFAIYYLIITEDHYNIHIGLMLLAGLIGIWGFISVFCGIKSYKFAKEMKKNTNVAYVVGFITWSGAIFYYWWNIMATAND